MAALVVATTEELLNEQFGSVRVPVVALSLFESGKASTWPKQSLDHIPGTEKRLAAWAVEWWNGAAATLLAAKESANSSPEAQTRSLLAVLTPDVAEALATRVLCGNGRAAEVELWAPPFLVQCLPLRLLRGPTKPLSAKPDGPRRRLGGGLLACFRPPSSAPAETESRPSLQPSLSGTLGVSFSGRVLGTLLLQLLPQDIARAAPAPSRLPQLPPPPPPPHPPTPQPGAGGTGTGSGGVASGGADAPSTAGALTVATAAVVAGGSLPQELLAWARMGAACLEGLPVIVTVFAADGTVRHQNTASAVYFGPRALGPGGCRPRAWRATIASLLGGPDVSGVGGGEDTGQGVPSGPPPFGEAGAGGGGGSRLDDVLSQLFVLEPSKLEQLLASTVGSQSTPGVWEGIIRVPASLNPHIPTSSSLTSRGSALGHRSAAATGEGYKSQTDVPSFLSMAPPPPSGRGGTRTPYAGPAAGEGEGEVGGHDEAMIPCDEQQSSDLQAVSVSAAGLAAQHRQQGSPTAGSGVASSSGTTPGASPSKVEEPGQVHTAPWMGPGGPEQDVPVPDPAAEDEQGGISPSAVPAPGTGLSASVAASGTGLTTGARETVGGSFAQSRTEPGRRSLHLRRGDSRIRRWSLLGPNAVHADGTAATAEDPVFAEAGRSGSGSVPWPAGVARGHRASVPDNGYLGASRDSSGRHGSPTTPLASGESVALAAALALPSRRDRLVKSFSIDHQLRRAYQTADALMQCSPAESPLPRGSEVTLAMSLGSTSSANAVPAETGSGAVPSTVNMAAQPQRRTTQAPNRSRNKSRQLFATVDPLATSSWQVLFDDPALSSSTIVNAASGPALPTPSTSALLTTAAAAAASIGASHAAGSDAGGSSLGDAAASDQLQPLEEIVDQMAKRVASSVRRSSITMGMATPAMVTASGVGSTASTSVDGTPGAGVTVPTNGPAGTAALLRPASARAAILLAPAHRFLRPASARHFVVGTLAARTEVLDPTAGPRADSTAAWEARTIGAGSVAAMRTCGSVTAPTVPAMPSSPAGSTRAPSSRVLQFASSLRGAPKSSYNAAGSVVEGSPGVATRRPAPQSATATGMTSSRGEGGIQSGSNAFGLHSGFHDAPQRSATDPPTVSRSGHSRVLATAAREMTADSASPSCSPIPGTELVEAGDSLMDPPFTTLTPTPRTGASSHLNSAADAAALTRTKSLTPGTLVPSQVASTVGHAGPDPRRIRSYIMRPGPRTGDADVNPVFRRADSGSTLYEPGPEARTALRGVEPLPYTGGEAGDGEAEGDAGDRGGSQPLPPVVGLAWHEVRTAAVTDPDSGARYLVVMQKDVTAKVEAERHIAQVSEAEHRLLEQIFPRHVLAYMTEEGFTPPPPAFDAEAGYHNCRTSLASLAAWRPYVRDCTRLATWHPQVTVLFADIQGFTPMCKQLPPTVVMKFLNDLFVRFDSQLDVYGVYKVETIGDCYVVAGGLITEDADGMAAVQGGSESDPHQADRVFAFAQAMLRAAKRLQMPTTGEPVKIRVGIHSGPVVSGVVGTRMPRFCLFGDTINTASRMESTSQPGSVHVSSDTYSLLTSKHEGWAPTGGIEVKGKGLMETHLWALPGSAVPHALADTPPPESRQATIENTVLLPTPTQPQLGSGADACAVSATTITTTAGRIEAWTSGHEQHRAEDRPSAHVQPEKQRNGDLDRERDSDSDRDRKREQLQLQDGDRGRDEEKQQQQRQEQQLAQALHAAGGFQLTTGGTVSDFAMFPSVGGDDSAVARLTFSQHNLDSTALFSTTMMSGALPPNTSGSNMALSLGQRASGRLPEPRKHAAGASFAQVPVGGKREGGGSPGGVWPFDKVSSYGQSPPLAGEGRP
ncbi:hypothetical protein HYH03_015916 [Edaphochlamys debaryana]|uniref:Guanylate cyclase domain-containing protein n=1 Tax=Edaphochlamys debaryana TaxID=47281 RepID=A0A836BRZ2_9CHLO|nr:hypothetical protein HYH03_015916 [Edaphochlamys debaryana]|eukprot:KAG2485334.1 hypothetical protein HYH03_015916 [Edaphochlamys debaryana]